ncbi:MAG: tandem-95 repeat protein, partial [Candidatus Thiodiazotropha sp. (ex Notomyrtea botanica)]|nr:tandem-95 repeat protein [Candidatus Thiodiazotropha sp. (ex Notomyrtea botanica)]
MSQLNYLTILSVLTLTITGCGGGAGEGESSAVANTSVSGTITKGIIRNGIVEVRKIENNQRVDSILASGVTDASGSYNLALSPSQTGIFELMVHGRTDGISMMVCDAPSGCGSYANYINVGPFSSGDIAQADRNGNGQVDFGESHPIDSSFVLKSLRLLDTTDTSVTAHITPLTHLVAEITYSDNRLTPAGLAAITDQVKTLYGLSIDPTMIHPLDLSDASSAAAELLAQSPEERDASLLAAALFASIAEQATLNGETLVNALGVVVSAAQNILNGTPLSSQESLFEPSSLTTLSNDVLAAVDSADLSTYINFSPVAEADFGVVTEGSSVIISVLDGDSDADGDSLSVTNLTAPTHGTVHLNSDGTVTYTHDGSETNSDSFTYTASDGVRESTIATVNLTVTPQNDAPVADNDSGTVSEGGTVTIIILTGDSDAEGDSLSVTNLTAPSHGTVQLNGDGSVTYTHNGSNTTSDSFTYTASDGVSESPIANVSISVLPQNDAPVADNDNGTVNEGGSVTIAVLNGDSDADGDSLSVTNLTQPSNGSVFLNNNGSITYTHDGSETLLDSFTYTASDGINTSAVATVSISVLPQNDAPVADSDSSTVIEGGSVTIAVLIGDSDAEDDSLNVTNLTTPGNGSVLLNSDGTVTYTHDGSESSSDSFTYTATDGILDSNVVTVNITITPQNDPPVFSTTG